MKIAPHKSPNYIITEIKFGGGNLAKLRSMPGHQRWKERHLIFRPTAANTRYILDVWPDAEWADGAIEAVEKMKAAEVEGKALRSIKHIEQTGDGNYEYKRPPMDHQRQCFLLSRDKPVFGLFMEQGTGKTKVIADNAAYLFKKEEIEALVVVAWPNGVHRNWIDTELPEDIPDWAPYRASWWSPALTKKKVREYEATLGAPKDVLKVFTFNVEAFASKKAKEWILRILTEFRCMMVIDQSASIKNPTSKRTEFLTKKCAPLAPYRRILDGAPVAENAGELYAQFKFLDPIIIGHDTWTAFKAEFCQIGYFNNVEGYKNLDELHRRIDGFSYRVLEKDCLDLPPRRYKRWMFDLGKEEQRIYDELRTKSLAHFEEGKGKTIKTELALVKHTRLQQIASGWWPDKKDFHSIGENSRLRALELLIQQLEGKALIFARFRPDLEAIQELLGDQAVSYHGGISGDDRVMAKKRFMNDDSVLYFIGQPVNAGIGHTLTAAHHVIFYANHPSLRFREESEKRAHRKGLEDILKEGEHLMIWDLVAANTTDEKGLRALREKKDLATMVMQDAESFFLVEEDDD